MGWEGYREGYDDAHYLTTLLDAMRRAKSSGKNMNLVNDTQLWLDKLTIEADLEAMRLEMARRIQALSGS